MDKFGESNCGKCCILIAGYFHNLFDEPYNRIASAFCINDHAGIKDQSHTGGCSGSRWLLTTASRSWLNASSNVAVEPCSRAMRSDSESNRTCGSTGCNKATGRVSCSMTTSAPARTRAINDVKLR